MYKTHRCTVRIYTAVICVYIEMVAPNKQPMFRIYIINHYKYIYLHIYTDPPGV